MDIFVFKRLHEKHQTSRAISEFLVTTKLSDIDCNVSECCRVPRCGRSFPEPYSRSENIVDRVVSTFANDHNAQRKLAGKKRNVDHLSCRNCCRDQACERKWRGIAYLRKRGKQIGAEGLTENGWRRSLALSMRSGRKRGRQA